MLVGVLTVSQPAFSQTRTTAVLESTQTFVAPHGFLGGVDVGTSAVNTATEPLTIFSTGQNTGSFAGFYGNDGSTGTNKLRIENIPGGVTFDLNVGSFNLVMGAIHQEGERVFVSSKTFGSLYIGSNAGYSVYAINDAVTGWDNTFVGVNAGRNFSNSSGSGYKNTFIGGSAGIAAVGSFESTHIGYQAGQNSSTDRQNTTLGSNAGNNMDGRNNVYIGYNRGATVGTRGSGNVFVGSEESPFADRSPANTCIGLNSCRNLTSDGVNNTTLGANTGNAITTGDFNTFIGAYSGQFNTTGVNNLCAGTNSCINNVSGQNNVMLGFEAGQNTTVSSGSVFIGFRAGYSELGSYKLIISSSADNPLIYGDFATRKLGIDLINPVYTLQANGVIHSTAIVVQGNGYISGDLSVIGNVGIGTLTPAGDNKVTILTSGSEGLIVQSSDTVNATGLTLTNKINDVGASVNITMGSDDGALSIIASSKTAATTTDLVFYISDGVDFVEKVRLNSAGRLGVGTTSPGSLLDVNGGIAPSDHPIVTGTITPSQEGEIRYNATLKTICVSTGTTSTSWKDLVTGNGC